MNLKNDVALFRAVVAAGFSLSNVQSVATDDGCCWSTVLCFQKKKVLRASNGGFGGPDEICQLVKEGSPFRDLEPAADYVDKLMDLPVVADFVRNYEVEMEQSTWQYAVNRVHAERTDAGGTQTVEEIRAELELASKTKVETLLKSPAQRDPETVAMVIGALTDIRQEIARMKRTCKTKLAWFKKGTSCTQYVSIAYPDTPANRLRVEAKYGAEMDGYVNDLIAGL